VENTIIMEGAHIDCGGYIIDSLIGRKVRILSSDPNLLKVHRRILGGMATVTL
jgi:NDP-sugar pyrophosphorylase family protein